MIPRLFRTPLAALISAVLIAAMPVSGALAQERAPAAAAPQAPAAADQKPAAPAAPPAQPATVSAADPNMTQAALQQIADANQRLSTLSKQVNDAAHDDEKLTDLKLKADELRKSVLDISVSFNPRLSQIRDRLAALGDPPAQGVAEDPTVKAERERLTAERAKINTVIGDAENLSIATAKLSNQIGDMRRTLFAETLFKKTDVDTQVLSAAYQAFEMQKEVFTRSVSSWFRFVWIYKSYQLMSAIFFSSLSALLLLTISYRMFAPLFKRSAQSEMPAYISKVSLAFWSTLLPSLSVGAFAAISYFLMDNFNVLRADIAPILWALLALIVAIFFVFRLTTAVLAPLEPAWRLARVSDRGARLLTAGIVALATIVSIDFFLSAVSAALGSDVVLTVVKSYIASILAGIIIFAMSFIRAIRADDDNVGEADRPWPRPIRWLIRLTGLLLVATALLGYVGLARFVATQIVMAGAVVVLSYIGIMSGRAIIKPGVFADTIFGQFCRRRFKLGELELDQVGLAVGFGIYAVAIGIGVPSLLLQWGFQFQEIWLWLTQVFTEVQIGKFRFSLMGLLAGVVLFFLGLYVTRWLQRWLDGNVLSRSKLDSGVRNSVKTGFGYVGIAFAALFGISAAGIDLSSLALVAGALSLGIGFGLQNIVSNFVSGLILLVERPFKVGDWVVTGTTEGFVRRISVRATEIETFQHLSIIVPNSELINASVGNWTHKNRLGRVEIPVGVSYSADPRRVMEILLEIAQAQPKVLKNPEPVVAFQGFGDSTVNFEIRVHLADVLDGLGVRNDLRLAVFERFKEEGIEFPFPQRDLHIKIEEGMATILRDAVARRGPFQGNPEKVHTNMGGLGHRPEDDDGTPHEDDGDGDGDGQQNQ